MRPYETINISVGSLRFSLHVCCRSRHQTVALWVRLACATAKAMAQMHEAYPIWWRGADAPPPAEWAYMFDAFTGDETAEEWALSAAIYVAQVRRRTGAGPTYSELFAFLLPDTRGLPGPFPPGLEPDERRRVVSAFRGHVAIEWRRRGMISFDKGVKRSLRVGREFRERSRQRQQRTRNRSVRATCVAPESSEVGDSHGGGAKGS